MKYLTENKRICVEDGKVFKDGKLLEEREYIFYSSYISDFTLIQEKDILVDPEIGIVLVIFSGENISEQMKIIDRVIGS